MAPWFSEPASTLSSGLPDNLELYPWMANEKASVVDDVRIGKEQTITFTGIDLLPERNLTLYTLAVLTFVRTAFATVEKSQGSWADVITQLATRQAIEEPLAICHRWSDHLHLDNFDDVFHVPIFERSLRQVTTRFGRPDSKYFQEALQEMLSIESPVALITVRPPVCMACLKIFDSEGDVFVVFSPRPVPGQNGLSVTFCNSVELIAHRLCNIMPIMDRGGTPGGNLNWQARLLSNCSSYIFVPRLSDDIDSALEESIMYSSLSLLTMQAEHADLQRQKQALVRRSQDLEKKVEDLRRRLQEEKDDNVRRHIEPHPTLRSVNKYTWLSDEGEDDHPSSAQQQDSKDSDSDDFAIPPDDDPNLKLVLELQRAFDDENLELTTQRDALLKTSQRQYHCGICLDDFPEDDVVHIDTCEHKICRDCARGHVSAKINEHRFPVLCPVCTADPQNRHPGEISGFLVQLLGVSEEQYETWVEMEMAQFSVLINCRKCNQSAFVDRADAIASDNMRCPLPRCGHVWCKKCQQTIENNVEHSCDGSKEFENLVQQKQWKYCPSCRTPIEKQFGCNHLSCIVPGCNTHFCYGCGVTINRTAVPSEIMAGKTAHFRTCRLH